MDQDTVDRLARLVGSGQSRRRILKTLAGGAIASMAASIGLDRAGAAKLRSVGNSCNTNADCSSGLCVQEARTRKICHCGATADCPNSDRCQPTICSSGACVPGTSVACAASDQCHNAGTCNPSTGLCSNPAKANGATCNDGNLCTQTDTCQNGVCTGGNPKSCAALDQCHTAGTCNPSTGQCSNPTAIDGTVCTDGDSSTCNDVCTNGVCAGTQTILDDDRNNCGSCGHVCPGDYGVDCFLGACCQSQIGQGAACSDETPCCSGSTCQNDVCCSVTGGACAGFDDVCCSGVCGDDNVCCEPEDEATTCSGKCGTQTNNCGQSVECDECDCVPDSLTTTCFGHCGETLNNNCGQSVICGACTCGGVPEALICPVVYDTSDCPNSCFCTESINGGSICIGATDACNNSDCTSDADCTGGAVCAATCCTPEANFHAFRFQCTRSCGAGVSSVSASEETAGPTVRGITEP